MKSYPYIGQCYSAFVLFYAEGDGVILGDALGLDEVIQVGDKVRVGGATNITREYLKNTWGVVESKEHAEFIIELAENAGFDCDDFDCHTFDCDRAYFYTTLDSLDFVSSQCVASDDGEKQITIPLPPKEALKNAGDNLILGCEDSRCDEWPQVGDEVSWVHGEIIGIVKCIDGDAAWISTPSGTHTTQKVDRLKKPKTPEEELRDNITEQLEFITDNQLSCDNAHIQLIADAMVKNKIQGVNITKKTKG